jgi:hypothetical protein
MLFDPKWEKKTKTSNPLTLKPLIAWLKQQNADEAYDYDDSDHCLLGRYLAACGWTNVFLGNVTVSSDQVPGICTGIPTAFQKIAITQPHTLGAALKRARAAARA